MRYPTCKGAPRATSNKCKKDREVKAKARKSGDSREQRNLNRIEGKEDRQVGINEIKESQERKNDISSLADIYSNNQLSLEQKEGLNRIYQKTYIEGERTFARKKLVRIQMHK